MNARRPFSFVSHRPGPRGSAALLASLLLLLFPVVAAALSNIVDTAHNLSSSGTGEIKTMSEHRICIFCHTPHDAAPSSPLWNKELKPLNYTLYESSTLGATSRQPSGASRLCLSCHDGTIALGQLLTEETELEMTGQITPIRPTFIGTDISDDHPVSFSYYDSLPNDQLAAAPPPDLLFYGTGNMHCSTCHDPHDNSHGKFLAHDNTFSELCIRCHLMDGWAGCSMAISSATWNGAGDDPWPHTRWTNWLTVAENGCASCHRSHGAGGPKRLMSYLEEERNCFVCHNGNVASKDIETQFAKISRHNVEATTIGVTANAHDPAESPAWLSGHVECQDCHNPHAANSRTDVAPFISGRLDGVSGLDINGTPVNPAVYEYQICFKCHSDTNPVPSRIVRTIDETNTRLEFDTSNPSYHPVVDIGRNTTVQTLPSTLEPGLNESSIIYCTDCHDSDESPKVGGIGPRGPHGSTYRYMLRERYEVDDYTLESNSNYALCYRCHDRDRLLSDAGLYQGRGGGHSGHLADGTPCSACHDPHGVADDPAGCPTRDTGNAADVPTNADYTGCHEHLINFDTIIVQPAAGRNYPIFIDRGDRQGSCVLICHGVEHSPANAYYPYP